MSIKSVKKIIIFFTKHTKYQSEDVLSIEEIHNGYTNQSFLIKTNDKKQYQIRIGNAIKTIDRLNEATVLKLVKDRNFIFFDCKNGNAIKQWITGHNPVKNEYENLPFLSELIRVINKLHKIKVHDEHVIKNEYNYYLKISKLDPKHYTKYVELLHKYEHLPLVLSHNDINPGNIIYHENKIHLIDYEWSRLNNKYWDLANFIREVMLPIPLVKKLCSEFPKFNFEILKDWIYISTNFSFQWTYGMQPTSKILKYRELCTQKMNYYYDLFFKK